MWNSLKELLASKKAIVFFVSLAVTGATYLGLEPEQAEPIASKLVALAASYLVGQGVADHGKERAKVEMAKP